MKCRAAAVLIVALTAVGAAAQSSSNGSFSVVDPGKFFSKPAQLNGQNASFTVDATDTDSNGDLRFFHFHADSKDSTQDSWLLVLSSSTNPIKGGAYIVGTTISADLTNFNQDCAPSTGTVSIAGLQQTGGNVTQISGNFSLQCTTTQLVTGSFQALFNNQPGNGGGGGGGTGGFGGSVDAGLGKIPGLGTLPVGTPTSVVPPTPAAPTIGVTATLPPSPEGGQPTGIVELNSGETATVKIATTPNETFTSPVTFSANGTGLTFTFAPPAIESPGRGSTTLTIGTSDAVRIGDQHVDVVARGANGVVGRTTLNIRVNCDPPKILGIDQPRSSTIAQGKTATMQVKATGSGPYTYQWFEGHRGSLVFPVDGATGPTLTTPSLQSGTEYWVRVSNPCGSVDSQNAVVNVLP